MSRLVSTSIRTKASSRQTITRCDRCDYAIWSVYNRFNDTHGISIRFVVGGTLDHPNCFCKTRIITLKQNNHMCALRKNHKPFPAFVNLEVFGCSIVSRAWPQAQTQNSQTELIVHHEALCRSSCNTRFAHLNLSLHRIRSRSRPNFTATKCAKDRLMPLAHTTRNRMLSNVGILVCAKEVYELELV